MPNLYYQSAASLQRIVKPVTGGYCKLYYLPVEYFNNYNSGLGQLYPKTSSGCLEDTFSIKYSWMRGFIIYKRNYREEQKAGDGGPYMEITVTAILPFENQHNHQSLDILKYHRYIVLVQFASGLVKILGSYQNPVQFSHVFDSGEGAEGIAGTAIKFSWISEDKPLLYKGAIAYSSGAVDPTLPPSSPDGIGL